MSDDDNVSRAGRSRPEPWWLRVVGSQRFLQATVCLVALGLMVHAGAAGRGDVVSKMVDLISLVLGIYGVRRAAERISGDRAGRPPASPGNGA